MLTDNREDDGEKKEKDRGERGRERERESAVKKQNKESVELERFTTHSQAADRP